MTDQQAADSEILTPQADFELDELTVVILGEGPARSSMERDEVQRLLNEHLHYTVGLVRSGRLLAAGALIDHDPTNRVTGLGFSRLTPEALAGLVAQDPAMKVGLEGFRVVGYRFPKGAISFPREEDEASKRNKALSRRLYEEIFGRGNLEVADEILADSCVSHGPGAPPATGSEGIKRQATLLRAAIPDLAVTLHDQLSEGDRVASRWTGSGAHTGQITLPSGPVPATGNHVSFDELRVDRHSEGRIVESWFIPDRMTLWTQFGLLPSSGA